VHLTLDARLQRVAEAALAHPFIGDSAHPSEGGAAVMVDVRTGEILVLASHPVVDHNQYVRGFPPGAYRKIEQDPTRPELNRAIAGLYPPASTFKMISGCAALEQTSSTTNTTFRCTGRIYVGARHEPKTCWKPQGHGYVQFDRAVAESCDVYFWESVRQAGLGSEPLAAYARKFGLGELTGCGLPGEKEGLVPTPAWKREAVDEKWLLGDTINMVIGQGSLTATPLQMAMVTAAVANGGTLLPSRIVRKVVWPPESGLPPVTWASAPGRPVEVKPETLRLVRSAMRLSVVSPRGTGHRLADLPIPVAAKTGSAEIRMDRRPHSWFVCFAPYENPRYACAVIVEYGGHGSEVAGNVARQIMQAAFATPPARRAGAEGGPAVAG
jgi:penicillin-binding protein 2